MRAAADHELICHFIRGYLNSPSTTLFNIPIILISNQTWSTFGCPWSLSNWTWQISEWCLLTHWYGKNLWGNQQYIPVNKILQNNFKRGCNQCRSNCVYRWNPIIIIPIKHESSEAESFCKIKNRSSIITSKVSQTISVMKT